MASFKNFGGLTERSRKTRLKWKFGADPFKYSPTFLSECENGIKWASSFVEEQLKNNMFKGVRGSSDKAKGVVRRLTDYRGNKAHNRHINYEDCIKIGLILTQLRQCGPEFQDLIFNGPSLPDARAYEYGRFQNHREPRRRCVRETKHRSARTSATALVFFGFDGPSSICSGLAILRRSLRHSLKTALATNLATPGPSRHISGYACWRF